MHLQNTFTSKSQASYAQNGIYFIYLGAVALSRGFIIPLSTASFINLDMLADDETGRPKRSLNDELVKHELWIYIMHACI